MTSPLTQFSRLLWAAFLIVGLRLTAMADITSGLIMYLPFNESSGTTAADLSGLGHNGVLNNFPTDDSGWVAGVSGNALRFNGYGPDGVSGAGTYVITANTVALPNDTTNFTWSFWAKSEVPNPPYTQPAAGAAYFPSTYPNCPRLFQPNGVGGTKHWGIWTYNFGVGIFNCNPGAAPQIWITTNAWHHFTTVYTRKSSNPTFTVYRDGVSMGTYTGATAVRSDPNNLAWVIGHVETLTSGGGDNFFGSLDEVRLYNRVLSAADAQELYYSTGHFPLAIATQPQGATLYAISTNDSYSMSVGMERREPGLAYQWRLNGADIPGKTSTSLVFLPLDPTNSGEYSVVITNTLFADSSITSSVATLTVTTATAGHLTNDLVAYYPFDETSGTTAADASGNGYGATLYNFPTDASQWVDGVPGVTNAAGRSGALQFNASDTVSNNYVLTDTALSFSDPGAYSFAFWAKRTTDSTAGNPRFISPQDTHWVLWRPGTGVGLWQPAASPQPAKSSWVHYVVTYSRTNYAYGRGTGGYTLYVNGVKRVDNAMNYPKGAPSVPWVLGHSENVASDVDSWHGCLDDVRIYNRILTTGEAEELYYLADLTLPPVVADQPQSESLFYNDMFWPLSMSVSSILPVTYQWRKDGVDLPGATGATYGKTVTVPVAFSDAGGYTVVVSNYNGSVTSAVAVVTVVAPTPQLDDGMVLHLKLDETSGSTAADATTNLNHGTLSNYSTPDSAWTNGVFANALKFNVDDGSLPSTANVIVVSDAPSLNLGMSSLGISMWVKARTGVTQTNGAGLLNKGYASGGESYGMDYYSGGGAARGYRFYTRAADGTIKGTTPVGSGLSGIANGTWEHLAVIYDMANARSEFYLNGVLKMTGTTETSLQEVSNPVTVGARENSTVANPPYLPWQGMIDDVRLYNRALTPIEVRALAYQGLPPRLSIAASNSPPVVSWPLEATAVYELQAAPDFSGTWTNVPGVVTNSVTVTPSAEALFYRLHRK